MKNILIILLITLSYGFATDGCTDPQACNYDSDATVDDASCMYGAECCLYLGACDELGNECNNGNSDACDALGDACQSGSLAACDELPRSVYRYLQYSFV